MVNTDEFTKRLENIFDFYGLTASSFADKIGVQRSSLSHLLSGRNKPSLDFVMKVIEVFPEVDLYWILNGKGTFPKSDAQDVIKRTPSSLPTENIKNGDDDLFSSVDYENENSSKNSADENFGEKISNTQVLDSPTNHTKHSSEIDKIVIFYTDGTFTSYNPKK